MRITIRTSAIILAAALILSVCATFVRADKPAPIYAYDDGQVVTITVVNGRLVGIDRNNGGDAAIAAAANPIYFIDGQDHVLSIGLGDAGYNPYWDIISVTVLDGRDVTTDPFKSEAEILAAAKNGEVMLTDSHFVLLCQEISK